MKLISELMPHQRKATDFALSHNTCALYMKPGLGKSLCALASSVTRGAKRVLITSDKNNILNTWETEVYKHTIGYDVVIRPQMKDINRIPDVCCVLCNYEYMPRHASMLSRIPWDVWIGDESSLIKDHRRDKTTSTYQLVKDIPVKMLLNGTPMTEKIEDLWGQFKHLDGGKALGRNITQFRSRYMAQSIDGYGWVPLPSALTRIQKDTAHLAYWAPKDAVKMPEVHRYVIKIPMTEKQKELDITLKEKFSAVMGDAVVETNYAATVFGKRVQLGGGMIRADEKGKHLMVGTNKLNALDQVLNNKMFGDKFIVWHKYIHETDLLAQYLGDGGVPFKVVASSSDKEALHKFQKMKAGVCLIRTAYCRGLNQLADADTAIFYSNPFSYMERAQAEGRTRRLNTPHADTYVVDLITEGGADEVVYNMIQHKANVCLTLAQLKEILTKQ